MLRSRRALLRTVLALVAAPLLACSDSTAPLPSIDDVMYAPSLGVDLGASTRTTSGMAYRDLQVGTGAAVALTDTVTVSYVGTLPNGTRFDPVEPGTRGTFTFAVGIPYGPNGLRTIPGFEEGVTGMRAGGRRQLIIPPSLAYGRQGALGGEALVFDIELVSVQ